MRLKHPPRVNPLSVLKRCASVDLQAPRDNEWQQAHDTCSTSTGIGLEFLDIQVPPTQRAPLRFTFFWKDAERWEGSDFGVKIDVD